MRRDDVVTAAAGEPRPAVVVQTDAFPETHASIIVCQMTSVIADAGIIDTIIDEHRAVPAE